ncbi:unnamed protein product [Adineta ricciae]|uniref:Uncharacterized protein n=1 Tax=Adineta ricciae TaxID=249248 RepID=A0A815CIS8_ADIRI|nr:unnamed protein product [Adineta ricciae]
MSEGFPRQQYKHRFFRSRRWSSKARTSVINEKIYMNQLNQPQRSHSSILSFYDNQMFEDDVPMTSKWAIVRQRLPDILALSPTYKPFSTQAQLLLLVGSISQQAKKEQKLDVSEQRLNRTNTPSNVVIHIAGRRRLIYLKHIPSDQMIHVDVDHLSFSIPTRQFILAISRGDAYKTAARYCPPAISDLLITLSQTKVIDDGRQYKRALYKMRIGQSLFLSVFILISAMMFFLVLGMTNTLFKLNSLNHINETILVSGFETEDY